MDSSVIIMVLITSVIYLKSSDCAVEKSCYKLNLSWKSIFLYYLRDDDILCETKCQEASANYAFYGTSTYICHCREAETHGLTEQKKDKCEQPCEYNTQESCGGDYWILGGRLKAGKQSAHEYGEWSSWNTWTFCEVNCVREDTTNGIQRRRRKCNHSKCLGVDIEEKPCYNPGICKGMRPKKLLCKCPKRLINTKWHFLDGMNITDVEVRKMVVEDFNKNIKSEISVDKKTVSKEVRKKNSSVNKRKSSQFIGRGCIVFLILPVVFLIAIDILNCCIHFQSRLRDRKRNRIGPTSDIQDLRDSSKPLQENANITESYYAIRCGNDFHPDEVKLETYQRRRDDNNEEDRDKWLQYM
ncbi:uncharacterized protein [Mytilus edulis]|uniref:uncharacterized protein n=1 Tax=Mytilus edulis TaxID=6550 RepID=UPI0039EF4DA5